MPMPPRPTTEKTGGLRRFVPILAWLPRYDRSWIAPDVIAGLTLWGLVVPEAMAYAGIAGLPPEAGLYTILAAYLAYALLGTSRHLAVGATSATAALLASSVAAALLASAASNASDPLAYQAYAAAFVLTVGVVYLAAGFARLGFVTQFLSKPVMDGFVVGLALFVAVGQLYKLFGVEKPEGNTVEKLVGVLRELPQANWTTFAVGAGALLLLFGLPLLSKKIPSGLVVLFGAIALSSVLDLSGSYGVEVVGSLPQGLSSLAIPQVPLTDLLAMILPAIGVVLVAYSEGLGVAHEFADKHGYEVDADQELNANAAANVLSALFGGMIAGGGMSGSAVKEGAGARSQIASLVTWAATVVTVLFLTPLFATLPEAVLGALIIHAVWHIIASRKLVRLRQESRTEVWFAVLTLWGVLLIDVLQGMIIGLVSSLLFVVYRTARPHVSYLGRVPGVPGAFSDMGRHAQNTAVPGVLIVRPDAQLYYANALTVRDEVRRALDDAPERPRALVLDLAATDALDLTTADLLGRLVSQLSQEGTAVYLAEAHLSVLDDARRMGLMEVAGEDRVFPTVDAAVRSIERRTDSATRNQPESPAHD